jgi:hypothetical protein
VKWTIKLNELVKKIMAGLQEETRRSEREGEGKTYTCTYLYTYKCT